MLFLHVNVFVNIPFPHFYKYRGLGCGCAYFILSRQRYVLFLFVEKPCHEISNISLKDTIRQTLKVL